MRLAFIALELARLRSAELYAASGGTEPEPSWLAGGSLYPPLRQPDSGHTVRWRPRERAGRDVTIETLRRIALFSGLSRRELAKVARLVDSVDLPAGYTVIREGDQGREFFVIASGTVRVTQNGHKLGELGSGEWVGEIALMSDTPRTATVVTKTPAQLIVVTDRGFRDIIGRWRSIARQVQESFGERTSAMVH